MLNGEIEQKLSLLARRVWAAKRSDRTLKDRLSSDPARFLQENGIAIPDDVETRVSVSADSVSFRFLPRKTAVDANGIGESALAFGDGSIFFRFDFRWVWD